MNAARVEDAIRLLGEVAAERDHAIANIAPTRADESDGDVDAESPVMDLFVSLVEVMPSCGW